MGVADPDSARAPRSVWQPSQMRRRRQIVPRRGGNGSSIGRPSNGERGDHSLDSPTPRLERVARPQTLHSGRVIELVDEYHHRKKRRTGPRPSVARTLLRWRPTISPPATSTRRQYRSPAQRGARRGRVSPGMTGGAAVLAIIPGWSKSVARGVPRVSWTRRAATTPAHATSHPGPPIGRRRRRCRL
jgi:hypothetical protein